jgi:hypothetical protein
MNLFVFSVKRVLFILSGKDDVEAIKIDLLIHFILTSLKSFFVYEKIKKEKLKTKKKQ